jgi:hypothetical protein
MDPKAFKQMQFRRMRTLIRSKWNISKQQATMIIKTACLDFGDIGVPQLYRRLVGLKDHILAIEQDEGYPDRLSELFINGPIRPQRPPTWDILTLEDQEFLRNTVPLSNERLFGRGINSTGLRYQ